ncbi:MAG: hypothetical protein PHC35_04600 [Deltaproteobacteria bacterium]|jgi:hypothetical protein|nr:hypothetical protein [Deltaproteobacteria bacterium]
MRCPKCGTIDFDYLTACPYCKTDLTKIKEKLGGFVQPPAEPVKWLTTNKTTISPAVSLQELDVSDLVRDDYSAGEPVSIELEPLDIDVKDISQNEEFKKKLNQLDELLNK